MCACIMVLMTAMMKMSWRGKEHTAYILRLLMEIYIVDESKTLKSHVYTV